ncbi:hypothetical protein BJ508DRAFT_218762, partial [Ascobolus immersus RN42]
MDTAGYYFDPKKARVGFHEAKLLGKMVDAIGVVSDPSKVKAVETFEYPTTLKALEKFVGLVNY